MASLDSSLIYPRISDDPPHTFIEYHLHTTYDADFGGPSAVNPVDSHRFISKTVVSQHTLHGFEIQTLESMSTLDNVSYNQCI
ncbi:hypothetical protein HanHA300_Chr15g0577741 [Helianthus annuus]|nr:hypothetical protein HanHA300_Chr15g0577741 [Helianthus annuus]KAJ0474232.1 hypothetical protein HanHA89_Chr15g0627351 [Helianthus annuus]KAJ0649800.1 hypothetical protein HanLR1_Chr15g0588391 [Helianthus annuus]